LQLRTGRRIVTEAAWTAIGLSSDLQPGAAIGVTVEGREWALWRGVSGRPHLWEDRCPHRGARLSHGFVRDDHFGCLYHGWEFDESGHCSHTPGHSGPNPSTAVRIRGVPVAESGGVIWACFAEHPPAPPSFDGAVAVRSIFVDAPLSVAKAALGAATPAWLAADAFRIAVADDIWIAAGQKIDDRHSALHIAAFGGTESAQRAQAWAAGLSATLTPAMALS
jgi:nitrite reductase/ring-hydroxylating ferredoxin subunit